MPRVPLSQLKPARMKRDGMLETPRLNTPKGWNPSDGNAKVSLVSNLFAMPHSFRSGRAGRRSTLLHGLSSEADCRPFACSQRCGMCLSCWDYRRRGACGIGPSPCVQWQGQEPQIRVVGATGRRLEYRQAVAVVAHRAIRRPCLSAEDEPESGCTQTGLRVESDQSARGRRAQSGIALLSAQAGAGQHRAGVHGDARKCWKAWA